MGRTAAGRMRRSPGRLELELEGASSIVEIGSGSLSALREAIAGRPALAVIDAAVRRRHGRTLDRALGPSIARLALPGGEAVKTPARLEQVWRALARAALPRDGVVVGIGGGTILDLTGFAAATWQRGTPYLAVPTTLLAAADASVGGKTAVDLDGLKNPVGAFHAAERVLIDTRLLATLPRREWRCGMAEIVKIATIGDPALFRDLEAHADGLRRLLARGAAGRTVDGVAGLPWAPWLESAVAAKARIVVRDFREGGLRRVLNLGHTLAHALEPLLDLPHGDAVSLGLAAVCRTAADRGDCTPRTRDRIVTLLAACGLPTTCPPPPLAAVRPLVERDKKKSGGAVNWIVPERIGRVRRDVRLDLQEVLRRLAPSS